MVSKVTRRDHAPPNDAFNGALLRRERESVLDFHFCLLLFTHGKEQLQAMNQLRTYAFFHFLQAGFT